MCACFDQYDACISLIVFSANKKFWTNIKFSKFLNWEEKSSSVKKLNVKINNKYINTRRTLNTRSVYKNLSKII